MPRLLRMPGICGVVSASSSVDPERIAAMSATLAHRGPDGAGEFSDGTAARAARVVRGLIDDHVAGREDLSRKLWGLMAFTLWHERHVEREPGCVRVPELLAER